VLSNVIELIYVMQLISDKVERMFCVVLNMLMCELY